MLVVVGAITVQHTISLVSTHFSIWQRRERPATQYAHADALTEPTVRLIDKELTQSTIVLGHLGISRGNADYYAVSVMNYILGSGGFSSRLMDSIRDRQGLAYGVYSRFDANLMPGPFAITLQTRSETTNKAITGVLLEVNGMRQKEVSEEELADAKAYLMGSFPLRLDTIGKLARVLSLVEFYGLGLEYFTEYPNWIAKVTKADVLRVAKQYLHPDRYALVVVGNQAKAKVKLNAGRGVRSER